MSTVQCTSKKNRHKKYIHKSHQGYKYKRMWQCTGRSGEGEGSLTEGRREREARALLQYQLARAECERIVEQLKRQEQLVVSLQRER